MLTAAFVIFLALVAVCLLLGKSVAWALLGGLAVFWMLGLRLGFTNARLWTMAWEKCKKSLIVVSVIALIGVITGLWRTSGTIAFCIVRGVELVTPGLFLFIAFLLCAALSYVLGTSYGVSSTMGVILMALARSGGVSPAVTAGVVLSGVYFGDRCSPASSAAILVAAVTETDSWTALLPAAVMFLLPLFKTPIKLAMCASIACAAVLACTVQGFSPAEVLSAAWGGYHPADPTLSAVLGGGGVTSMTASYVIVLLAGLYSGILEGTGALEPLSGRAEALAGRIGRFPAMIGISVLTSAILCNQAVASIMVQQLMGRTYASREELAMDIENSVILIAGLIPWSIACSIPLSMLGSGPEALPYAFLLWLIPACYLFTKKRFYP